MTATGSRASGGGSVAWPLRSEFAQVSVHVDERANGPRLCVRDLGSGAEIYLDPLELVCLARSRHAALAAVIMPEEYLTETDEWALHPH